MDAGKQLVRDIVNVPIAENPVTPSKVAAVVAGATALLPVPLQLPETVKLFVAPFAKSVVYALCKGKGEVEATGPVGDEDPPPPPQATTAILKSITKSNLVVFNFYLPDRFECFAENPSIYLL